MEPNPPTTPPRVSNAVETVIEMNEAAPHPVLENQVKCSLAQKSLPQSKPQSNRLASDCKQQPQHTYPLPIPKVMRFKSSTVTGFDITEGLRRDGAVIISGFGQIEEASLCLDGLLDTNCRQPWELGVFDDTPQPKKASRQPHSRWKPSVSLPSIQTECPGLETPPAAVGYFCGLGSTSTAIKAFCVASLWEFMRKVCTAQEREWMMTQLHDWSKVPGPAAESRATSPVFRMSGGRPVFRWESNALFDEQPWNQPDEIVVSLMQKLADFTSSPLHLHSVEVRSGDLVLVDNHTCVRCQPTPVSESAHLSRLWMF